MSVPLNLHISPHHPGYFHEVYRTLMTYHIIRRGSKKPDQTHFNRIKTLYKGRGTRLAFLTTLALVARIASERVSRSDGSTGIAEFDLLAFHLELTQIISTRI